MYKFLLVFLVCVLISVILFSGCGGDGTGSTFQVATATPAVTSEGPLSDPELCMLGDSAGTSGTIFSPVIDFITAGLKGGVLTWIGKNTTGRVLDVIGNKIGIPAIGGDTTSAALAEMSLKLDLIINQLGLIENQLDSLTGLISLSTVTMEAYVGDSKLQTTLDNITTSFDSPTNSGLIYYADNGCALDPNSPDPETLNRLKSDIAVYYTNNTTAMQQEIQHIAGFICPSTGEKGGLTLWAQKLVLSAKKGSLSEADFAMTNYLTLETYFSRLLIYQTKALMIVLETLNYHDPDGITGANYLDYYYKNILKPEIIAFQKAVNILMINLVDYRTLKKYQSDAACMNTVGLVHDDTYLMVLARSRFFCTQVINSFEQNFGLYGAIVTPYDYTTGTGKPVTSLTLKFSGPVTFTTTVNAQNIVSQFPYTKWHRDAMLVAHASPDQNWSFYDFSSFNNGISGNYIDPNIPGGTYDISIVDNGDKNTPWFHTDTTLGRVTVKYYDPNNPTPDTATTSPTDTNTVKFGCFSGRWNWGFNSLSSVYGRGWMKPSKNKVPYIDGAGDHKYLEKDNPTLQNVSSDATYWPDLTGGIFTNEFGTNMPEFKCKTIGHCALAYSIIYTFTADSSPSAQATHNPELYYDLNNKVYYYNDNFLSNDCVNSHCKLNDETLSTIYYYADENTRAMSSSEGVLTSSGHLKVDKSEILLDSLTLEPQTPYTLQFDTAESFSAGTYEPTITSKINIKWNIQVIYPYTDTTVFVN